MEKSWKMIVEKDWSPCPLFCAHVLWTAGFWVKACRS